MHEQRDPQSPSDETIHADVDGETTLSDEEWPVAEHYRVAAPPETFESGSAARREAGESTVVVQRTAPADPRPVRRFPPDVGPGLLIAVVAAILLIPAAIWLATIATDDSEATPPATQPTTPTGTTTDTTPTQPTETTPARLQIPRVVGVTLEEAKPVLEKAGFRVRVTREASDEQAGVVLRQSPAAGAELGRDGIVRLTVSAGTEQVEVPRVIGLQVTEAADAIRAAGLQPELRAVRSTKPADTVIGQSPASGSEVDAETVVRLDVATPPPAPATVEVPRLLGLTSSEARRQLRDLGLRFTVIEVASDQPVGTVVGQTPRAGREIRKAGTVTLRVSSGPADVLVPDVVGLDEQSARQELEAAGFEVRVVDVPTADPSEDGFVISQDPPGESSSPKGSVITLRIARFS